MIVGVLAGVRETSAAELRHAWSRDLRPDAGSYMFQSACSSPTDELLVVASARAGRGAPPSLRALRFDTGGASTQRELSLSDQRGRYWPRACIAAGDGFLLVGERGERGLDAVWLGADLAPAASRSLVEKRRPTVTGLVAIGDGRFAAAGDDGVRPHLIVFDRVDVKHYTLSWPQDRAVHVFDLVSSGESVAFCGLEGAPGRDLEADIITDPHLVVGSFGLDGKEQATLRFPGVLCRLFRDADGGVVMLRDNAKDPAAGSTFVRFDRELREIDRRPGPNLFASSLSLWAEAAQLGSSFVVLRPAMDDAAFHLVEADTTSQIDLELATGAAVMRAGAKRVYLLSNWFPKGATGNGLRVDAFDLVGTAP